MSLVKVKLLVNEMQVQILSIQQNTILHYVIASFFMELWTNQHSSIRIKEKTMFLPLPAVRSHGFLDDPLRDLFSFLFTCTVSSVSLLV